MSADHRALVVHLAAQTFNKGNVSHTLKTMEHKHVITIGRTPQGKAEYLDLTPEGRTLAFSLLASCD